MDDGVRAALEDRLAELQRLSEDTQELLAIADAEPAAGTWAPDPPAYPADDLDFPSPAILRQGRVPAPRRRRFRRPKRATIVVSAVACVLFVLLVHWITGGVAPSWPAGVLRTQAEVTQACQNPDVRSEPNQVNFACAKSTRQILWVFALMTSGNNPNFANPRSGRVGLEPIPPQQGGVVSWSLNLHHPYSPLNPVDSIQVAARAINNIIGGATAINGNGRPVVQPGLESDPANCTRYTGSSAVTARGGFPGVCARPLTAVGRLYLVYDVFQRWYAGASASTATDAVRLFEYANDPGSTQVRDILAHLP